MDEQAPEVAFRDVMGRFPTGVTVVATLDASDRPVGLTVNSFTSVSLDPPLVLVCIDRSANSHDALLASSGFAVSILSLGQGEAALRFATEPSEGRFEDVAWKASPSGNPVLSGAAAWLDCVLDEVIHAGDHSILIGRPASYELSEAPSLVFHSGAFGSVGP